jgi:hypothetical protein
VFVMDFPQSTQTPSHAHDLPSGVERPAGFLSALDIAVMAGWTLD